MLFVDPASTVSLVNEQQYRQWYQEGRLKERKILRALVTEATRTLPHYGEVDSVFLNIKDAPLVSANYTKQGDKHREPKSTGRLG